MYVHCTYNKVFLASAVQTFHVNVFQQWAITTWVYWRYIRFYSCS